MNKKVKKWYKLDNAAKIFPPTVSKKDTKVFRVACEFYEDIEKDYLQDALNKTLEEYPLFKSSLKKGLFWYYLETSSTSPQVTLENQRICDEMSKNLLFRVSYYKKRINLEVHHSLTDGTGIISFLKLLVSNYLINKYNMKTKIVLDDTSIYEKELDSYKKYYRKNNNLTPIKKKKAYNLSGNRYPNQQLKVIEGIVPTKEIIKLAKYYNTTVTVYIVSLLIKSIAMIMTRKEKNKPISITIPVNLRKYFNSNTARNFFNTIVVSYKSTCDEDDLKDIIIEVDRQLKENLKIENISKQLNSFSILENIFIVRVIPVFIKDIVLKFFHNKSRKEQTIALSNVGIIEMPKEFQQYIKLFDIFSSTDCTQVCMCSYLNNMTISFTSHFINTEIQKNFFKNLSKNNIDVVINENFLEDLNYEEML